MAFPVGVVRNMSISTSDNCTHNDNRVTIFYCDHVGPTVIRECQYIIDYCLG